MSTGDISIYKIISLPEISFQGSVEWLEDSGRWLSGWLEPGTISARGDKFLDVLFPAWPPMEDGGEVYLCT